MRAFESGVIWKSMVNSYLSARTDSTSTEKFRPRALFSWTLVNFWLDGILLIVFLALIWVSLLIRFVFPATSNLQDWQLWGRDLPQWIRLQFNILIAFCLGILLHLMLHWSWICGVFSSQIRRQKGGKHVSNDGARTIYGVVILVGILAALGILTFYASLHIRGPY